MAQSYASNGRQSYSCRHRLKRQKCRKYFNRTFLKGIGIQSCIHGKSRVGPFSIQLRGNNGVYLAHRDNMRARTSASGLVLISEYNTDPPRVEGAIFFLGLRGAGGTMLMTPLGLPISIPGGQGFLTDYFTLATFLYEP